MDISIGRLGSFALMDFGGPIGPHHTFVASEPPILENMTCRGYRVTVSEGSSVVGCWVWVEVSYKEGNVS